MNQVTRYSPLDDLFRGFFVKPMDFPSGMPAQQIKVNSLDPTGWVVPPGRYGFF